MDQKLLKSAIFDKSYSKKIKRWTFFGTLVRSQIYNVFVSVALFDFVIVYSRSKSYTASEVC